MKTDNITQMITVTIFLYSTLLQNENYEIWLKQMADNVNQDHIKWLPHYKKCFD
jgi:hypothetical protein